MIWVAEPGNISPSLNGEETATTEAPSTNTTHRAEGAPPIAPFVRLERAISYRFKKRDLLKTALVHKSYLHAVPDFPLGSNERLEFLGDAVLGLIVSSDLYRGFPDHSEGMLTAHRGVLVRLNTLAEVAAPLNLGGYMYMSRGEEAAGGRQRSTNLGRAIEALLGAVYIDGGLKAVTRVWHTILGERTEEQIQNVLLGDYKSELQKQTQANLKVTPSYRIVETTGPDHSKVFTVEVRAGERVLAQGSGRNKQIAEQAAASEALKVLEVTGGSAEVPGDAVASLTGERDGRK